MIENISKGTGFVKKQLNRINPFRGLLERRREKSVRRKINAIFANMMYSDNHEFKDEDLYSLAKHYDKLSDSESLFLREAVAESGRFDLMNCLGRKDPLMSCKNLAEYAGKLEDDLEANNQANQDPDNEELLEAA